MKAKAVRIIQAILAVSAIALNIRADTHYADVNNASPAAPYTSWATAASSIQDAVDAAASGDTVLVAGGTYNTGGAVTPGFSSMNRVVVTSDIVVQSVSGPDFTFIVGEGPVGSGAVRGVCMFAGTLSGFTVTNGHTMASGDYNYDRSGGGINMAGGSGVTTNCTLSGNSADYAGGGSRDGTLNNCTLSGNSASRYGGGSYFGTLNNCTLSGNLADSDGGGSSGGTLNNCKLTGNSATGAWGSGGGNSYGTLNNCTLSRNSAHWNGGGSYRGTLNNCTLTGNSASRYGGGSYFGTLNNCIVYFNTADGAGENWYDDTPHFFHCCTTPLPGGTGNITDDPMLVGGSHIHAYSPCVDAGSAYYTSGTDIDGDAWAAIPSMGCDEPLSPFSGNLDVSIVLAYTNVVAGHELAFTGDISGKASSNRWTFGDGQSLSNAVYGISHTWPSAGIYDVVLTVYNDDHPDGISATTQVRVVATSTHYVDANNNASMAPYSSWATAATNIQDAVDEAAKTLGSETVLVSDGVYDSGGAVAPDYSCSNRVVITKDLVVCSVNGPETTFIVGASDSGTNGPAAVRGVYMSAGTLSGFTVTNGHTQTSGDYYDRSGGGINMVGGSGVATNCTLTDNLANDYGGGSYYGTLNNCTLSGNSATESGGGSYRGTLNNCTLSGNSAYNGGGSYDGTLNTCTLMGNSAHWNGGGSYYGTLNNCTLSGNSAGQAGGGNSYGTLTNCTLSGNSAGGYGGGSYYGTLNNCTLLGNSATGIWGCGGGNSYGTLNNCTLSGNSANDHGGGSYDGTLNNCTLTGNSANDNGGGSYDGTLNNCMLSGNSANDDGGGSSSGTLNNCTLSGNSAKDDGGGSYYGTLNNCIVYFNTANGLGGNWYNSTLSYCCTTPHPGGTGSIAADPMLISASHIATNSPCRSAGSVIYTIGTDIDGEPWLNPPSIGCDENLGFGSVTGNATAVLIGSTSIVEGFTSSYMPIFHGAVTQTIIDYKNGLIITNQTEAVETSWSIVGMVEISLTVYNDSHPDGMVFTQTIEVLSSAATAIYVSDSTGNDARDGGSWFAAKKTIQAGVDVQNLQGGCVFVSNGSYTVSSEIVINKSLQLLGIGEPSDTLIEGGGSTRCFNLGSSHCIISGFTIRNGHTAERGGGIYCTDATPIVTNCTLSGNSANDDGGGSYYGTLNNCTLSENVASRSGGGSYYSTLNNCTLSGNSANSGGGGSYDGTLNTCTLMGNSAAYGGGSSYGTLNNCTFTENAANDGGGSYDCTLINCTLMGNSAAYGGGSHRGTLTNCTLSGNSADSGGGSYQGTLNTCTLSDNSAGGGGGSCYSILTNCTITGNLANERGGGSYGGTLNNCTLTGNLADFGGGSYDGTLNNCTLTGNSANDDGGGSRDGTLNNCTLSGNSAARNGGGSNYGTLNNCSLTGNTAAEGGGGSFRGTLNNCIVYFNTADGWGDNWYDSTLSYCCTTPRPGGTGNIAASPQFVDAPAGNFRLAEGSPCIDAGNNASVVGATDLDGNLRIVGGTVDMGAYEFGSSSASDTDGDGIPDWWETQYYGGATSADPSALCFNGVNTVMEAYIAGFDPTDPDAGFAVQSVEKVPEGFVVNWNSVTGRVYDVLWTPDLDRGFQILETGIEYPVNSYTDTVHSARSSGYYMVAVRLPGMNGDMDGDGLPDIWESAYFSSSVAAVAGYDFDGDGQSNTEEYIAGTNPTNATSLFKATKIWRAPVGTVVEWVSVTGRVYTVLWAPVPGSSYDVLQSGIDYPQNSYTDTVHGAEQSGFYKMDVLFNDD